MYSMELNTTHAVSTLKFGWKRSIPSERVLKFEINNLNNIDINGITEIDLRDKFYEEVYNQENIGSCTANAICGAFIYEQAVHNLPKFYPSRLFLYYNEREMLKTIDEDSGAFLRDGMISINKIGLCSEELWPYDTSKYKTKPNKECYGDANFHKAVSYKSIHNTLNQLKTCLANKKLFVFGFDVYTSFNSNDWDPKKDIMPMPDKSEESLGGHAVLAVGFLEDKKSFIIRNSWGKGWGMDGCFLMPYEYIISNKCADFWVIDLVVDNKVVIVEKDNVVIMDDDKFIIVDTVDNKIGTVDIIENTEGTNKDNIGADISIFDHKLVVDYHDKTNSDKKLVNIVNNIVDNKTIELVNKIVDIMGKVIIVNNEVVDIVGKLVDIISNNLKNDNLTEFILK